MSNEQKNAFNPEKTEAGGNFSYVFPQSAQTDTVTHGSFAWNALTPCNTLRIDEFTALFEFVCDSQCGVSGDADWGCLGE